MADEPQYTWARSLRYFMLGMGRACIFTLIPVVDFIYNWAHNWNGTPIYWPDVWRLTADCAVPAAAHYWLTHKHLLVTPPLFDIPPAFRPEFQVTKSTAVTVPTDSGGTRTVTVEEKEPAPKG